MRPLEFAQDEYYHIYNRGVDKRDIVGDQYDSERFLLGMFHFNDLEPIGSIYEHTYEHKKDFGNLVSKESEKRKPLVEFIAYCLNPNHFHFILKQLEENGISKLMHRQGLGYTKYFNKKHKRSGALFQGTFKAKILDDNDYLLHASAYVNLNDRVHKFGNLVSKNLVRSSWNEYLDKEKGFCEKDIILDQFKSITEYKDFCEESLELMWDAKDEQGELKDLNLLEY